MRIAILIISLIVFQSASTQICRLFEKIPADSNQTSLLEHTYGPNERMEVLQTLIEPDSIRYYLSYNHLPEDEADVYFELDTFGIHVLDLDLDGDLDFIYSAQSGPMGAKSTTIYLTNNGKAAKDTVISGGLIDIYSSKKGSLIYTLWKPCCDSYTNRLENYLISSRGVNFIESVSYIGRSKLKHVPNFKSISENKTIKKGAILYAFKLDFRNVHPYFRKDNEAYYDEMKQGRPIVLMEMNEKCKAIVLGSIEYEGETYYAVLSKQLMDVPKSHFEWSAGDNRRFVAWVKAGDLM